MMYASRTSQHNNNYTVIKLNAEILNKYTFRVMYMGESFVVTAIHVRNRHTLEATLHNYLHLLSSYSRVLCSSITLQNTYNAVE